MSAIIQPRPYGQDLTFRAFADSDNNGIANLDTSLTINSITETPSFLYVGTDATESSWPARTYGSTATKVEVGTNTTTGIVTPFFDGVETGAQIQQDYYTVASGTNCQIDLEDFVIEVVGRWQRPYSGGNGYLATTFDWATHGWELDANNATLVLSLYNTGAGLSISSDGHFAGEWFHAMFFIDRDQATAAQSGICHVNGLACSTGSNISAFSATTLTNGNDFFLGSDSLGFAPATGFTILWLGMWKHSAWFAGGATNTTHWNACSAERAGKLIGWWPQIAQGTELPNIHRRNYAGYGERLISSKRYLYRHGYDWLRIAERPDSNGDTIRGYLVEPSKENLCDESNDWTAWTKSDAGDTVADDFLEAPNGYTEGGYIIADSTDGVHKLSYAITGTADAHCFSVWAKPGNNNWIRLENETVANAYAYFNVSTGAVGTTGAGCDEADIEGPYNNDWYRCCICHTATAGANTMSVHSCAADNDNTFAGDGSTKNTYLFGAQVENDDYMTSYIETDGATATRLADELQFVGDDGNLGGVGSEERGTIEVKILSPHHDTVVPHRIVTLSDAGVSTQMIALQIDENNDYLGLDIVEAATQTAIVGATALTDDTIHHVRATWQTNDSRVYTDGVLQAQDTSGTVPDDLDEFEVGASEEGDEQFHGILSDLRIWRTPKDH